MFRLLALAFLGITGFFIWFIFTPPYQKPVKTWLKEAREALEEGDFETARFCCRHVLNDKENEQNSEALLMVAEASAKLNKFDEYVRAYDLVPDSDPESAVFARQKLIEYFVGQKQYNEARPRIERLLEVDPENPARHQIVEFDLMQARWFEALPHLAILVNTQKATREELVRLCDLRRSYGDLSWLDDLPNKTDLRYFLGKVSNSLEKGATETAIPQVKRILLVRAGDIPAFVTLGRGLLQTENWMELKTWIAEYSDSAELHPDLWYVRGEWLAHEGRHPQAVRCYLESLHRYSENEVVLEKLANSLRELKQEDRNERILARAATLKQLQEFTKTSQGKELDAQLEICRHLESLGRYPEAVAWLKLASQSGELPAEARQWAERLSKEIGPKSPLVLDRFRPELEIDQEQFPLEVFRPEDIE